MRKILAFVAPWFTGFFCFGFGGSDSSSSQSTSNTYNTDNSSLAASSTGSAPAIVTRGNIGNVEVMDAGAINAAFGFAERNASAYADATKAIVSGYGSALQTFGTQNANLAQMAISANQDTMSKVNSEISSLAQQDASALASFAQFQSQSESGRLAQLIQWGIVAVAAVLIVKQFSARRAHA